MAGGDAGCFKCHLGCYLKVFRQVAVVNFYESLFSQNTARCPLAARLICLRAPLNQQKQKKTM